MAGIAREAGVSRQALYLHFESRAGLLLAMVRWVDEREHFFEQLQPLRELADPAEQLAGYVKHWLDYLPQLYPVPGFLARARSDRAARDAWADRMSVLEELYRVPLRKLHKQARLRRGLGVRAALDTVRATTSVHAWEYLVHERGWSQQRALDTLWRAASAAILRAS